MTARFQTTCPKCRKTIRVGAAINTSMGRARHAACVKTGASAPAPQGYRGAPPEREPEMEEVLARI